MSIILSKKDEKKIIFATVLSRGADPAAWKTSYLLTKEAEKGREDRAYVLAIIKNEKRLQERIDETRRNMDEEEKTKIQNIVDETDKKNSAKYEEKLGLEIKNLKKEVVKEIRRVLTST